MSSYSYSVKFNALTKDLIKGMKQANKWLKEFEKRTSTAGSGISADFNKIRGAVSKLNGKILITSINISKMSDEAKRLGLYMKTAFKNTNTGMKDLHVATKDFSKLSNKSAVNVVRLLNNTKQAGKSAMHAIEKAGRSATKTHDKFMRVGGARSILGAGVRTGGIDKALSTTIESTSKSLNNLTAQAVRTNKTVHASVVNAINKSNRALRRFSNSIGALHQKGKAMMVSGTRSLFTGLGMAASAALPMKVAMDYEYAFKDVRKSVSGTEAELRKVHQAMKDFGAVGYSEMAKVYSAVGKMGIAAREVPEVGNTIIKISKALDVTANSAIDSLGAILVATNSMDNAAQATAEIGDLATHLENVLPNIKVESFMSVWARGAKEFTKLGFSLEEMAGMTAHIEQNFMEASSGAEAFRMMINTFLDPEIDKAFGFMDKLRGQGLKGLQTVIGEIEKMSESEQISAFGRGAMKMIDRLVGEENRKNLATAFATAMEKEARGAVDREWSLVLKTFRNSMDTFKNRMLNIMESIGTPLIKAGSDMINWINPLLEKVSKGLDAWLYPMKEIIKEGRKEIVLNEELAQSRQKILGIISKVGIALASVVAVGATLKIVSGAVLFSFKGFSIIPSIFRAIKVAALAVKAAVLFMGPQGIIVLGITAITATVAAMIVYWEEFKNLLTSIKDKFLSLIGYSDSLDEKVSIAGGPKIDMSIKDIQQQNAMSIKAIQQQNASRDVNMRSEIDVNLRAEKGTSASVKKKSGPPTVSFNTLSNGTDFDEG